MPTRDPPQNPLLASTRRAASIGQLSQASSFEEVRLEDLDRHTSSDSEEDHPRKPESAATAGCPTASRNLKGQKYRASSCTHKARQYAYDR